MTMKMIFDGKRLNILSVRLSSADIRAIRQMTSV